MRWATFLLANADGARDGAMAPMALAMAPAAACPIAPFIRQAAVEAATDDL
jgi:hypothetical protein